MDRATRARSGCPGAFNATSEPLPLGTLLDACRAVADGDARVTWVDEAFLLEREVGQWMELPLWVAAEPGSERFHENDTTKAHGGGAAPPAARGHGARHARRGEPRTAAGLAAEREAELLAAWHARD